MNLDELRDLDHSALLALLIACRDDLLRLIAIVQTGDLDGAEADAAQLEPGWQWGGGNQYSDGTVITAEAVATHTYAPPHYRGREL